MKSPRVQNSTIDRSSSSQPAVGKKDNKFQNIIDKKAADRTTSARANTAEPDKIADSKRQLAEVLKGGKASTHEVVALAVRDHPLFKNLPERIKNDLIQQVGSNIDPLLKGVSS